MSIQHTRTLSVRSSTGGTTGGGASISATYTETGSVEVSFDDYLSAGITNYDVAISVTEATLQSLVISSDTEVTIKTNSTTVPDDTWVICPGRPLDWGASVGLFANPVTADITHLYITTSLPARVRGLFLNS